jgi:hypothetical protein
MSAPPPTEPRAEDVAPGAGPHGGARSLEIERSDVGDLAATRRRAMSAAVDRFTVGTATWSARRVLDEGLDLVRDACWADGAALVVVHDAQIRTAHRRPTELGGRAWTPDRGPDHWLPWGLAPVRPDRFLLVDRAGALPVAPGAAPSLRALGITAALHLPIRERHTAIGALQVVWSEPRLAWDDELGAPLRALGRYLLTRAAGAGPDLR